MADAAAAASPADQPRGRRLRVFMETRRRDTWWGFQAVTLVVFTSFIVYATWAAFQKEQYCTSGPYLSPFCSPEIFGDSHHAWLGKFPAWWPAFIPMSPALLILPFPGGFRFTCYYYRGAYYKAFWADPPGCAVGEPRGKSYLGERYFPLIIQNVHRYFMYVAVIFIGILAYDVWVATRWVAPGGGTQFGIGLGTIVMAVNVCLLSSYTFGCHSLRHLVGGGKDALPKGGLGQACYDGCSKLNTRHQLFAWMSLFSVALTDVYIRLCAMGVLSDIRIV